MTELRLNPELKFLFIYIIHLFYLKIKRVHQHKSMSHNVTFTLVISASDLFVVSLWWADRAGEQFVLHVAAAPLPQIPTSVLAVAEQETV